MAAEHDDVIAAVAAAVGARYLAAAQIAAQTGYTGEYLAELLDGEAEQLERAVIAGFWRGIASGRAAAELLTSIGSAA